MNRGKAYRFITASAKICVSVGAVLFVLAKIDTQLLMVAFRGVCWWLLVPAAILFVASKVVSAFRLTIYFRNVDIRLAQNTNLKLYWLGMFYNLFLPGGIGGDGYKVWLLHKQAGYSVKKGAAAVLLDRVNGMYAIVLMALVLAAFVPDLGWYRWGGLIFTPFLIAIYHWLIHLFFPTFYKSIAMTTILSLLVQLLQVGAVLLIIESIGISQNYLELVLIFLVSSAVAVLPFTIGGVGAREVVFLYGATLLGMESSFSVAISFIFFVITAAVSLCGIYYAIVNVTINTTE